MGRAGESSLYGRSTDFPRLRGPKPFLNQTKRRDIVSVSILPFRFPGLERVHCAFQLRTSSNTPLAGGNLSYSVGDDPGTVTANRRDLLAACGVTAFAELQQVHGDKIVFEPQAVDASLRVEPTQSADGMAISRRGCALLIKTADCQPLLMAERSGRYVAALHVGWRGDRLLFPFTGVRRFCEHYAISPADCFVVRGPSLGPAQAQFIHFASEWGWYFGRYFDMRTSTVDLWGMTRDQLIQAGVPTGNIFSIDLCTATNTQLLYSYRKNHACGRQGSLIWLE